MKSLLSKLSLKIADLMVRFKPPKKLEESDKEHDLNHQELILAKKKEARKVRKHLLQAIASANAFLMFFLLIGVILITIARFGALTQKGQTFIESKLNGLKMGNIGQLQISGYEGDFFTKFKIANFAIKDGNGIWLDGKNIEISWSPIELFLRKAHVENANIEKITIYRKPDIIKSDKKLNIALEIDKLVALIETKEEFSVKPGLLGAALQFEINRNHDISANGAIISAKRQNDKAVFAINAKEKKPLEVKINASEANGGPIAGILGLNANLPFAINADIYASYKKGILKVTGTTGNQNLINLYGNWDEHIGKLNGISHLNLSKYTKPLALIFGDNAKISGNWNAVRKDLFNQAPIYKGEFSLFGPQARFNLSGLLDFKNKKANEPLNINAKIDNISSLFGMKQVAIGAFNLKAKLGGSLKDWFIDGDYGINSAKFGTLYYNTISGKLAFDKIIGGVHGEISSNANGPVNNLIIGQIFGTNPNLNLSFEAKNNNIALKSLNLKAKSININAKSGLNFLGSGLDGKVELLAPAVSKNELSGVFVGDFKAKIQNKSFILDGNAIGKNLKSKSNIVNHFLGNAPRLKANLQISSQGLSFDKFTIYGQDVQFDGTGAGKPNPFGLLKGQVKIGTKALSVFDIKSDAQGGFEFSGLDGKSPFALALDLNTKNFSTPIGIINQFTGDSPKIKGALIFEPKRVLLGNTLIISPKIRANMQGQLAGIGGYGLESDLQALSPINIGQFEIGGNPYGKMTIRGPHSGPMIEINSKIAELNIKNAKIRNANFTANINLANRPIATDMLLLGQTDYGAINGRAKLYAVEDGIELRNINLNGAGIFAQGGAKFLKNQSPSADFDFTVSKGLFLSSGVLKGDIKLVKNGNETFANIMANGQNFAFNGSKTVFETLNISGNGPLRNLVLDTQFKSKSGAPISFNGKTQIKQINDETDFSIRGSGSLLGRNFVTETPIYIKLKNHRLISNGKISLSSSANQNGGFLEYDLSKYGEDFDFSANLSNFNLTLFDSDFAGNYSGKAKLYGKGNQLYGALNGDIDRFRSRGISEKMGLNGRVDAELKDGKIDLKLNAKNDQGLAIDANTSLSAIATNSPLRLAIDKSAPLNGQISINGEMRPLTDLIFAGERTLTGNLLLDTKLGGSILKPEFFGQFTVKSGNYREPKIGFNLGNLNLSGKIEKDIINIENLSAKDAKGGELSANGKVLISEIGNSSFLINLKKFRLIDSDTAKIDASGRVEINSNNSQIGKMSGALNIDFAEFRPRTFSGIHVAKLDVEEINKPIIINENFEKNPIQILKGNGRTIGAPNIDLNVDIKAERGIFVRGRGLNLELSLNGNIGGKISKPNLSGIAKVYRGEYEYGGRTFDFEERGTIHLSSNPDNIRLDLYANRIATNLTAKISVRGTASNPLIELSSVPDLPKDEILAQVLFGRTRSQLTPLETVQLATSLAALASGGGFDVMANLRDIARLDRLVFANTASGEISVAGGKYLGRDVYIELISEGTQGISTKVEWRPRPWAAIVSKVGADGDAKISIRWRRDIK